MARLKYFDEVTQTWKYADLATKGDKGDPGVYTLGENETLDDVPEDAMVIVDMNGEEDVPASGGGGEESAEWKLLTHVEISEDVAEVVITQTDEGEPFTINELAVFSKAVERESVSSFKLFNKAGGGANVILQTNSYGHGSSVKYYAFVQTKYGNLRRTEMMEGNYDVFKTNGMTANGTSAYSPSVQYYSRSFSIESYLRVTPTNGFKAGDIFEIWYR